MSLQNKNPEVGTIFIKNGVKFVFKGVKRGMAILLRGYSKRGTIYEEIPLNHLMKCNLYQEVNI
jgi:hypothetical protein